MSESKPLLNRLSEWASPLVYLSSNAISLIGVVIVTTATVLWVFLLPTLLAHGGENPYFEIPAFLLLPGVFILGLILIPIGIVLRRRKLRRQAAAEVIPPLNLESPQLRRLAGFIAAASFVNVLIVSQWGYSAIKYMDGPSFCGLACHTVMQPEYTSYINSPHAHVECAECHIGPGASGFLRAKISGTRQLFAVTFHTYERPIPTPVENLRPASETCEHCHWPARFSGDVFTVRSSYGSDQANQQTSTVMLMKVGGRTWRGSVGIHGVHVDEKAKMVYTATDKRRQEIPQVTYTAADGKVTVYNSTSAKVSAADLAQGQKRTMDCIDCHSRPTHAYQLPERALDLAMSRGQISPTLPFVKKEGVAILRKDYPDRDTGVREITAALDTYYKTNFPDVYSSRSAEVKTASAALQAIYLNNIFPDMKVTWGTYPNNLGHMDFPGCFRCHDGDHQSADGRTIPNDCATCHDLLAVDEKDPKVLSNLGYNVGAAPGGQ